jgi:hypothetical protein
VGGRAEIRKDAFPLSWVSAFAGICGLGVLGLWFGNFHECSFPEYNSVGGGVAEGLEKYFTSAWRGWHFFPGGLIFVGVKGRPFAASGGFNTVHGDASRAFRMSIFSHSFSFSLASFSFLLNQHRLFALGPGLRLWRNRDDDT